MTMYRVSATFSQRELIDFIDAQRNGRPSRSRQFRTRLAKATIILWRRQAARIACAAYPSVASAAPRSSRRSLRR